ncbi:hypothetical protein [Paucimonas lemoignei]|uniref:hypothetical protein n=1 Tax=Paucimonas lemoignei TaxID=29443 RepID=UPI0010429ED6|nr:hypothetical protein [Paucimonas lemoignei]
MRTFSLIRILILAAFVAGCASQVAYRPEAFKAVERSAQQTLKTLAQTTEVQLDTGYSRTLKAGSQWVHAGTISQGEVYKPYKDVFTLEGAHIHEANLVVANDQLVGFYLPVERGFSSLARKAALKFN